MLITCSVCFLDAFESEEFLHFKAPAPLKAHFLLGIKIPALADSRIFWPETFPFLFWSELTGGLDFSIYSTWQWLPNVNWPSKVSHNWPRCVVRVLVLYCISSLWIVYASHHMYLTTNVFSQNSTKTITALLLQYRQFHGFLFSTAPGNPSELDFCGPSFCQSFPLLAAW